MHDFKKFVPINNRGYVDQSNLRVHDFKKFVPIDKKHYVF